VKSSRYDTLNDKVRGCEMRNALHVEPLLPYRAFVRRGNILCFVPPTFFSLGVAFGDVSKIKVTFVTIL